jgi:hypothetical protein
VTEQEPGVTSAPDPTVGRRLHDANSELSIAVLQIATLLESETLDAATREALEEALAACRESAAILREVWRLLGSPPPSR